MSNSVEIIPVNEKKEYHNCEMIFSCSFSDEKSDFTIDKAQEYKIYTTLDEVKVLNEALEIYQAEGFKEKFLLFSNEINPKEKYPEFVEAFNQVHNLGKSLQSLAKDEYSLTQLQEYCLEQAPTYKDDFMINKKIIALIIEGNRQEVKGYEELKSYLLECF